MNHKTNPLKNILQKYKNFSAFLIFVLKKIISLQMLNKNSAFGYTLFLKCEKFQKGTGKNSKCPFDADLLVCATGNFSQPQERIMLVRYLKTNKSSES